MINLKMGKWIVGLVLVSAFFVSGCRSTKTTTEQQTDTSSEWVDKMSAGTFKSGSLTAKLNLQLTGDGKSLSVGGTCNLKRDEVIQFSLVALGLMEVGRIEMTPDHLLMIDRMGRQYVKVDYNEVPYMRQAGIDFYTFQALFWNDLFVPGKSGQWSNHDFKMVSTEDNLILTSENNALLQCRFLMDAMTGLIRQTVLKIEGKPNLPALNWDYLHFSNIDQKSFPDRMKLSVVSGQKNYTASFTLTNMKANAKEIKLYDEPGSKYKKVDVQAILNMLLK